MTMTEFYKTFIFTSRSGNYRILQVVLVITQEPHEIRRAVGWPPLVGIIGAFYKT